ncbi:MAG: hypothetical protein ACHP79_06105 [Terriglobales bacterium]
MKRAVSLWLVCIFFSVCFFLPAQATTQPSGTAATTASATQDPAPRAWKRYRYEADGFSTEFPAEPKSTPNDDKSGTRYFTSIENDNIAYFAEVAQLPADLDKTPQAIFEDYAKGSAGATKSEIKSQKPISFHGNTGSEFLLENDTMFLRFRLILVGKKLYQLLVVATKDLMPGAEADRFLDAFQLIK